jgi:hypothetical protein
MLLLRVKGLSTSIAIKLSLRHSLLRTVLFLCWTIKTQTLEKERHLSESKFFKKKESKLSAEWCL